MKTVKFVCIAVAFAAVAVTTSNAQATGSDVYWRIDPSVKSCSMIIDPSLTQVQWKTFVKQVGAITSFKSLASAEPLGAMKFSVGLDRSSSPVNQHDPAWINTFVHPDADCPLGDAISLPALRARMGVSDNMDIGAYWTAAPNANYGIVGGEIKYRVSQESEQFPSIAVRGSVIILTGVSDFDFNLYSLEGMASKNIAMFAPYVGVRGNLAIGTETTPKVNLDKESVLIPQAYAGLSYSVWMINLAAEYNVADVNTFAMLLAFKI